MLEASNVKVTAKLKT